MEERLPAHGGIGRAVVAPTLSEVASIPMKIGVASGPDKAGPIPASCAAITSIRS